MKLEHVFLQFGSEVLEDYTAYTDFYPGILSDYPLIVNEQFRMEMVNHIDAWCDKTYKPKLGDTIHVVPDCALPIQDLRNNYKIKRDFDSASCNVFSNLSLRKRFRPVDYSHWMLDRTRKIIVLLYDRCNGDSTTEVYAKLGSLLPSNSLPVSDFEYHSFSRMRIDFLKISDSYQKLLLHQNTTPCVFYEQLPMNRNELTADLLYMLYTLASDWNTPTQQYIMQLSALAQTNWKEYPYTMWVLFENILKYKGLHYQLRKCNNFQKQISEIMTYTFKPPTEQSKKDISLLRNFSELLFHIQDTKFVSLLQLRIKLNAVSMPEDVFSKVYKTMVRIDVRGEED